MALRFVLPLLAVLVVQPQATQVHVGPRVVVLSAEEIYRAGITAATQAQWSVAAERFRQAVAREGHERPGYFPHYWLGVAYDELHETSKAFEEWRESQRQGAIAGTSEEAAMRRRMAAHMQTASRPPRGTVLHPLPQPQPVLPPPLPPQPRTTTVLSSTAVAPIHPTTMTHTAAMTTATASTATSTATTGSATTTEHQHDPMTPEGQLFDEIDRRFKALNPGELLIGAPHEMRVGVTEQFILRIASAGQNDGIASDLPTGGQTSTSTLHVTPMMRATLAGTGFTIQSTSDEKQLIGGGSFTEWSWQVTPTESGNRELVANVYVEIDGRVKGIPKRWPVHVSANPGRSFSLFLKSNWQWLSSTLVIPLALFFWRQRKKQT
jgi:hypothetical protein